MKRSVLRSVASLLPLFVLGACCQPPVAPPPPPKPVPVVPPPPKPMGPCPSGPDGNGNIIEAMSYPTGDPASSVLCVQKIAPAEVQAGDSFTYELRVTNTSGGAIDPVILVDRLPAGFSATDNSGASFGGDGLTWNLGRIGPGETKSVTVTGTAGGMGTLVNCAEIRIPNEICATTNVVNPGLELTKSGPDQVMKCDPITYNFVVSNPGSGTARGVVIDDPLPDGLMAADGSNSIRFNVGDLAAGESRPYSATVTASRTGTFTNSASASATNGVMASSGSVVTTVVQPALDITMSCPGYRLGLGTFDYNIAVTNTGDGMCNGTVVTATLPAGTAFVSATDGGASGGNTISWQLGAVAPGQSATMSFTVRATTLGAKVSEARVSCACAEPAMTDCTVDIQGIPAVLLEVVDNPDPVAVGETTTYTIRVTNQGSLADSNISITCELEAEAEFVSATGAMGNPGTHDAGTITFAALPSLAPGQSKTWTVVVRAAGVANTRFRTIMTTDQLTRTVEETESTNFYQ